jgi:hypothetical protein
VIVGAFKRHLTERGLETLAVAPGVAGGLTTPAGRGGAAVIGMVGVQAPRHRVGRHLERFAARRGLDGLEVEVLGRPCPNQRFDFGGDLPL